VNHNVYLPDEVSDRIKRAKVAGIEVNLSGLLRDAVTDELDRQELFAEARDEMTRMTVDATDREGNEVRLRFTGKRVSEHDPEIYLTDDGKVLLVFDKEDWFTLDSVKEFADWASSEHRAKLGQPAEGNIAQAVQKVGGKVVIDL
jgi:hypothetical protein